MDQESHHYSSLLPCTIGRSQEKCTCPSCQYNLLISEQKDMKAFPTRHSENSTAKMETLTVQPGEFDISAHKAPLGLQDAHLVLNSLSGIDIYQPFDSVESHRQHAAFKTQMDQLCANGNLELLQTLFDNIRESNDPVVNRQSAWEQYESQIWKQAYDNGPHWHVIEWLARQPEIHLVPTKYGLSLPDLVADRAAQTGEVVELDRLLSLGWEINQCVARTVTREHGGLLPSLRYVRLQHLYGTRGSHRPD
jgi:hypothetical protein